MIRPIKYFLLIASVMLMILGCGKKEYSEKKIAEIVKSSLQKKYGTEFTVCSVEEGERSMWLDKPYYVAECMDAAKVGPFWVTIAKDGTGMKDNYEGYLYQDEIETEVKEILSDTKTVSCKNYYMGYTGTEEKSGSFRKYVESGSVTLIGDFSAGAVSARDAADLSFAFIDSFQKKGYGISINIYWKDSPIIFSRAGNDPLITKSDVDKRFKIA